MTKISLKKDVRFMVSLIEHESSINETRFSDLEFDGTYEEFVLNEIKIKFGIQLSKDDLLSIHFDMSELEREQKIIENYGL